MIDGTMQPGFAGSPIIELNGARVLVVSGTERSGLVLDDTASGCLVRGLVINRFRGGDGILLLHSSNHHIEGNYIGLSAGGTTILRNGNGLDGIEINGNNNSAFNITIGRTVPEARNVISGNGRLGVFMFNSAERNSVQGNYIGPEADGSVGLGNGGDGVMLNSDINIIVGVFTFRKTAPAILSNTPTHFGGCGKNTRSNSAATFAVTS